MGKNEFFATAGTPPENKSIHLTTKVSTARIDQLILNEKFNKNLIAQIIHPFLETYPKQEAVSLQCLHFLCSTKLTERSARQIQ